MFHENYFKRQTHILTHINTNPIHYSMWLLWNSFFFGFCLVCNRSWILYSIIQLSSCLNSIIISISLTKISQANWNLQSFRRFFAFRMSDLVILNGKFKLVNEHMRFHWASLFFFVVFSRSKWKKWQNLNRI